MLQITIPATEQFNEATCEFIYTEGQTLLLEHSLASIAEWESRWQKPYLTDKCKTREETMDYIKCMTLNRDVDPNIYSCLTSVDIDRIVKYIESPMTATTFSKSQSGKKSREIITAEIIYYWMVTLNIPPEYDKWHFNRLITLIRVCDIKNGPSKKMSKRDIMSRNAALNAARRKQFNTTG